MSHFRMSFPRRRFVLLAAALALVAGLPATMAAADEGAALLCGIGEEARPATVVLGPGNTTFTDTVGAADVVVVEAGFAEGVTINSGNGDDLICGGDGPDVINAGNGLDTVFGGAGDDQINGQGHTDHLEGGDGNDTLIGENGRDTIMGGPGDDTIRGDGHGDFIYGGDGNDTVDGGGSRDNIFGGLGADYLDGNVGDDRIFGDEGADTILGGIGEDTLFGGDGNDFIDGGPHRDMIRGHGGVDELHGGLYPDYLNGGAGDDFLFGDGWRDTLFGSNGNDVIHGGTGPDFLIGGAGADELWGAECDPPASAPFHCRAAPSGDRGADDYPGYAPVVLLGDTGMVVHELQRTLQAIGYDVGVTDGSFGPTTDTAVRQFQADAGLVADGVAGSGTWAALAAAQGGDKYDGGDGFDACNEVWDLQAAGVNCETYRGERPSSTGWPENIESGEPWRPLVTEVFTAWGLEEEIDRAVAVLACESHGDPFVVNPNHPVAGGVWGLFQHWDVAWKNRSSAAGIPGTSPLDAWGNVTVAAWLVKDSIEEPHANGAWGHWACGSLLGYWPEPEE